jgi:hypothetical protein
MNKTVAYILIALGYVYAVAAWGFTIWMAMQGPLAF